MSIHWNFVTAPYAVPEISPVKLFFDNGLTVRLSGRSGLHRGKEARLLPSPFFQKNPLSSPGPGALESNCGCVHPVKEENMNETKDLVFTVTGMT